MKLVIFGISNFSDIMHYWFTNDSDYDVVAFTVDKEYLSAESHKGLPVVAFEDIEKLYPADDHHMFVAMGIQEINQQRANKVAEAKAKGYTLAHYLNSNSTVHPDLIMTPNSVIMDDCTIQPFVTLGEDVIIWSTTRVAMKTHLGDHSWIVSSLSGEQVTLGDFSFIGLGAIIAPGVTVGQKSIIGAGALVLKDIPEESIVKGKPSEISKVKSSRIRHLLFCLKRV